ncbi:MAG: hypothetical protein AAB866_00970, partial [Patescibacteria group bacterium]
MLKILLTILFIFVLVFIILPKITPHQIEIIENIPLILENDAPVSNLTIQGVLSDTNQARNINGKLPALKLNNSLN